MRKVCFVFGLLPIIGLSCFVACDGENTDPSGVAIENYCSDGTISTEICNEEGTAGDACGCTTYSVWCDDDTGLCWQDPQKDAYDKGNGGVTSFDAQRYCEELVLDGYDDWRLPNITELRSIIQGNALTRSNGLCYIENGSSMNDQPILKQIPCLGKANSLTGPDERGCYWKTELTGTCNNVDPASSTHYLEFWSTTKAADDPENWVAYVFFDTASVGFNHSLSLGEVRCVRNAPPTPAVCQGTNPICEPGATRQCACDNGKIGAQVCSDSGGCYGFCDCTGFTPSPGPVDVCGQCDNIKVKINVSKPLTKQPYMLAAFLYKEGELFLRPPDVGNDENEIRYPDINIGRPVEMNIPGCSYYRDRCMEGEYYLVVYLKMNEGKFPGMPELADYVWFDFDLITLTGDGTQHYEFDVTVLPILLSPFGFID